MNKTKEELTMDKESLFRWVDANTVTRERLGSDYHINVFSYETLVATGLEGGKLMQSQWHSTTTQKHVNYVARELNMELVKLY